MRPESSLQLTASSWQYWLHPESHRTRGFNAELWCSSPEGITRAVLQEMDPQHIHNQGCPSSTHSQYTNTCANTLLIHTQTKENYFLFCLSHLHSSLANLVIVYSPMISFTHTCTHKQIVTHYTQGYCYASYRVHITHSLSCQIMQSPIICSSMSCFQPSHTIITTLHSVTRKT